MDLDGFALTWLGDTPGIVLFFNLVLIGPAAFATGHAVALTWRPFAQIVFYTALLSVLLRFLDYALMNGELLSGLLRFLDYALMGGELVSVGGFLLGWAVQFAVAAVAFRLTRARQMVQQYPWLYRRKGLLGWEEQA